MQYTICSQCGSTITSKHRFCGTCGFPQKQKSAFRITRKWSFVILACLIIATGIGWRIWISTTYQPASCKILGFTENSIQHRSKHGSYTTYQPAFTALVNTHNGLQEEAISYDGPYKSDYSSYDEAQKIVSSYVNTESLRRQRRQIAYLYMPII